MIETADDTSCGVDSGSPPKVTDIDQKDLEIQTDLSVYSVKVEVHNRRLVEKRIRVRVFGGGKELNEREMNVGPQTRKKTETWIQIGRKDDDPNNPDDPTICDTGLKVVAHEKPTGSGSFQKVDTVDRSPRSLLRCNSAPEY